MQVEAPTEEDIIREIERSRLRALVAADIATAHRLHADYFQLITPIGLALSREEYLGAIAAGQIRSWHGSRATSRCDFTAPRR
jgi:hypothetical protein